MSKLDALIDRFLAWSSVPVPWYKFYDTRSGAPGGIIMGSIITVICVYFSS